MKISKIKDDKKRLLFKKTEYEICGYYLVLQIT